MIRLVDCPKSGPGLGGLRFLPWPHQIVIAPGWGHRGLAPLAESGSLPSQQGRHGGAPHPYPVPRLPRQHLPEMGCGWQSHGPGSGFGSGAAGPCGSAPSRPTAEPSPWANLTTDGPSIFTAPRHHGPLARSRCCATQAPAAAMANLMGAGRSALPLVAPRPGGSGHS